MRDVAQKATNGGPMSVTVPSRTLRRTMAVVAAALGLGWLSGLGAHSAAPTARPSATAGGTAPRAAAGRPAARLMAGAGRSAVPPGPPRSRPAGGGPAGPAARPADDLTARLWYLASPPGAKAVAPRPRVDCRKVKCIALTFDDGPGPYTAKLLDMLAARHVKVTFFLIGGNIRGREALVRRELAEGHVVGDHTWSHPSLDSLSDGAIKSQLTRTLGEIRRASGHGTVLMRPPYGATNRRVAAVARGMHMAQILWSVDTNDWLDRNSAIVAHRAVSWAHPGDIILMHDIHPTTVKAVPKILAGLSRRGFTFVTVPELFGDRSLKPGQTYFDGPVPRPKSTRTKAASNPKGAPQPTGPPPSRPAPTGH
ncbi:polysaccharide deacetylase family protein [Actinoallomurus rhizosphaericola]|uniref:polysaccharide deacetylase family protein n=1 Tax=Actinoallomurus rhizosphaericola TaxID=2952536 RepID=UPI0020915476|nr:polysaccharide deacetylase family protein [Actinoallomurus rhizosphaericola]MCO5993786.1 polysaccharide deacetylase family protein [Actinoallomurus rhizosphaericola]